MRFVILNDQILDNCVNTLVEQARLDAIEVEIKPFRKRRTVDQNRLYWVELQEYAKARGVSAESLHLRAKCRFLGYKEFPVGEKAVIIPNSTTKLTKHEFSDYLEQVRAWFESGEADQDQWLDLWRDLGAEEA